jgi:hypothetical protein
VSAANGTLLPAGHEVTFAEIEVTLARLVRDGQRRSRAPARALTATVVVVGEHDQLIAAADALEHLGESGGVRAILISEGEHTAPTARVTEHSIAIAGLAPRFLNNAVAALRLSSLPMAVWWRGGSAEALEDIALLADRLILDTPDPSVEWAAAPRLFERTAVTDLRWTRLTRWRSALAHLFDLPEVRNAKAERLAVTASDAWAARLFAGWLKSSLRWNGVAIDLDPADHHDPRSPLAAVRLVAGPVQLSLSIHPSRSCLHAAIGSRDASSRVVPLGDGSLTALIGEELGVRTRDLAFERALAAALEIRAWA